MSKYTIHEVTTKHEIKQWLAFPAKLYRHDPHYVRPLDREVEHVFNREDNKLFRHGDATRYYLTNERGKIVGRIAVFYDEKTSKVYENEEMARKPAVAASSTASTIRKQPTLSSTLPRNGLKNAAMRPWTAQ